MANEQIYLNDEKWYQCINSLKRIAHDILQEDIGLNEGSVEILAILYKLPVSIYNHPTFVMFRALSSETTHLPLPQARKHWNKDSLVSVDVELKEIEENYSDRIKTACEQLLSFDFDNVRMQ